MVDWLVVCNHVILSPFTHTHTHIRTRMHAHTRMHARTRMHAHTHAHTHAHMHTCTHAHAHTHTHTQTRTHTHTLHQVRNAAKAAFLPTDEKEELLKTLEEKLAQFEEDLK